MDESRRIRFLVAPTLFVASLLWGAWSEGFLEHVPDSGLKLVTLIAAGGIVVFAGGYVIGTITYFVLRLFFRYRPRRWGKSRFHEVALSEDAFREVWEQRLHAIGKPDRWKELFAGAAFDHGILRKTHEGVHLWLIRRWNAFNIAATSFFGLVFFSFPIGHFVIGIPFTAIWYVPVGGFAAILFVTMIWSWRDTMNMANFMATLPVDRPERAWNARDHSIHDPRPLDPKFIRPESGL